MLFDVAIHDAFLACDLLDFWEEVLLLAVMMSTVVYALINDPVLNIGLLLDRFLPEKGILQQILDIGFLLDIRTLKVNRIEASDQHVVCTGHWRK